MINEKEKLKREISRLWQLILIDGMQSKGFYQLEYLLMEAGLLARPRKRRKKTADEKPQHVLD